MTLEQLRIFIAVAEREHLTQAATELRLTPSAVSSAVKALEGRYGVALFHRIGRRIELTEAGRLFLSEARATFSRAEAAELMLSELGGLKRGTLAIQASQTIASYWLPRTLMRFHEAFPAIELRLAIGNTRSVTEAVIEGSAELGFVEGEVDEPVLSVEQVDSDRLIIVAAPNHPLATQRRVSVRDLAAAQWIMREAGSGTRSEFEAAMKSRGLAPQDLKIALELPSNEAVRSAVVAGAFVTAMSELVVSAYLDAGRLVPVSFELPRRSFAMLRHKERHRSQASFALQRLCVERQEHVPQKWTPLLR